jgi:hypothetical protein
MAPASASQMAEPSAASPRRAGRPKAGSGTRRFDSWMLTGKLYHRRLQPGVMSAQCLSALIFSPAAVLKACN